MIKSRFTLIFFFFSNLFSYQLDTFYGNRTISEPVLIELIECPSMQRLKNIHQYGISYFISTMKPYSRFEHSLGVFFLVKKFGGSLSEQIAALLHDVSHTVFSHVGDHVFKHFCHKNSYQDNIHQWFLAQTEIPTILAKYGITIEEIDHKNGTFFLLESDLPNLCADRIEYILYGGLLENQLTKSDIESIISSLHFEDNRWFFDNQEMAKKVGLASLYLTEHVFGSIWNFLVYHWTAKALRLAVKIDLIKLNDIHFSTDLVTWQTLCNCSDKKIKTLVDNLKEAENRYKSVNKYEPYDFHITNKFRGVDPLVKIQNELQPLTSLDKIFAQQFSTTKDRMEQGWYIRLVQ